MDGKLSKQKTLKKKNIEMLYKIRIESQTSFYKIKILYN
jgi:hypothetical protein